jgi:MIP family channel proteins
MSAAAAEFLGTALLVLIGPGAIMLAERSGAYGNGGIALAFGVAVAIAVLLFGARSGAHINPAVSTGLWLRGRLTTRTLFEYVFAQLLGALAGVGALAILIGPIADFGVTRPAVPLSAAFAIEFAYTALLGVAVAFVQRASFPSRAVPLFLGLVVGVGSYVTGPLTGGSFNPARSFAPALASGVWTAHWIYWLAPIVGFAAGYSWLDARRGRR